MAGPIDDAYVEIHPDTKGFARETKTDLDLAFASVERKLDDVIDSIETAFERLIVVLDANFSELTHETKDGFSRMEHAARDAADSIAFDLTAGADVAKHAIDDLADNADHDFDRIKRSAHSAGRATGTSFLGGLLTSIRGIGGGGAGGASGAAGGGGGIFSSITGLLGGGGDIFSTIRVTAIAAAIPIVISLGAALSELVGLLALLPGLIGGAVASIAPLIIAFHGFGEAIGAGFSGDAQKFKDSLKGLAEPAQTVVKEIVGLKSIFSDIRKDVQTAFFAPLIGQFRLLGTTLLPVVRGGLENVADALGNLVGGLLTVLRSNEAVAALNALFISTGRIITMFGPTLSKLFAAFLSAMQASLPFVERLFSAMNDGLGKFVDYLNTAISNGDFTKWLENAFRVAGELFDLLKSVGNLLSSVFGNADQQAAGEDFIQKLTEMTNKLADFFRTADGQKALKDLADITKELGYALLGIGVILANLIRWFHDFVVAIDATIAFIGRIPGYLSTAWNAIVSGVTTAWNAVKSFFVDGWNTVVNAISTFVSNVGTFINQLPSILENAAKDAFTRFFYNVGYGIGLIIGEFIALPGQIWGIIKSLWDGSVAIFKQGISDVTTYVLSLPGKVAEAFTITKNYAISIATSIWSAVTNFFKRLISDASSTAHELPGKIRDAWRNLVGDAERIGTDMINGMINGIKNKIDDLVGWAKKAVSSALKGAKDALKSFSPSREWMKLGADSITGYKLGAIDEGQDLTKTMAGIVRMPVDMLGSSSSNPTSPALPQVNVGGAQVVAYLQIGDDQLQPVMVRTINQHPQEVALAAENGSTQLSRRR